jgi:hypothetical protein
VGLPVVEPEPVVEPPVEAAEEPPVEVPPVEPPEVLEQALSARARQAIVGRDIWAVNTTPLEPFWPSGAQVQLP